jgi:hypothetical protein
LSLLEALIASVIMWLAAPGAFAQSIQTILANGPSSNRFNVVFFSEGYTTAQLGQFLMNATNAANALLTRLPYSEYRDYFNVYAISVASTQSGSDHPAYGISRATYFNSSYDALSDYLISIPPHAFDTNYSHGQGKLDALVQTFMPDCRLAVVLVNEPIAGGSDGNNKTAISYNGAGFADILIHETGHVVADLGDEYTNAYPGFPNNEEPNTTQETNPALIKWRAWISPETPIPTPSTFDFTSVVGLFQGAHYHTTGWYRPKFDCRMNHPSTPDFCEVCGEALVLSIYKKVRPIDSFSPASKNVSLTNGQALAFSLSLLSPATHSLGVQWFADGIAVVGATNTSLMLLPATFTNGNHVLSAVVADPTTLVRNDPTNLLKQTNTWNVTVNVPSLRLDSIALLDAGQLVFRVNGYAPQGFIVQGSTNLTDWTSILTNSLAGGQYLYTNTISPGLSRQFFRVLAR